MTTTMTRKVTRTLRIVGAGVALALAVAIGAPSAGAAQQKLGSEEFGLTFKQLVTKSEAVERRIAKCMQNAGFDYVANDFNSIRRAMNSDKTAPGLSEAEYRRQYGFGISTQPNKPIVRLGLGEQNSQIRAALSPTDQIAYDKTLLGEHTDAVFAKSLEAEDFSRTGGCTRKAVSQVFTKKQISASYINPGDQKVQQDQRYKNALRKYAACMNKGGFPYQTPDDIEPDIQSKFDAITGGADPATLEGADAAKLADLQDTERQVAQLTFKCEAKFIEPVQEQIEKEIYGHLPK
jgi:hypothetical protein